LVFFFHSHCVLSMFSVFTIHLKYNGKIQSTNYINSTQKGEKLCGCVFCKRCLLSSTSSTTTSSPLPASSTTPTLLLTLLLLLLLFLLLFLRQVVQLIIFHFKTGFSPLFPKLCIKIDISSHFIIVFRGRCWCSSRKSLKPQFLFNVVCPVSRL